MSSFQGDRCLLVCLYLLSPAQGKSASVWGDCLRTDCAFNCLICVEVAVDLTGPLLQWSRDPVWVSSSPANRDWHESALRMFYSVSSPLFLSASSSLSRSLCEVSHWFQVYGSISMLNCASLTVACFSKPDTLSRTRHKKGSTAYVIWLMACSTQHCGSNGKEFSIILKTIYFQTLLNVCLHFCAWW